MWLSYDIARFQMHQRHSIRLPGYDYAQGGAHYITLCTARRARLFGHIAAGRMTLSALGRAAEEEWLQTPQIRPNVDLDAFVVMPDHFHAVVVIAERADVATASGFRSPSHTLGAIVRGFKAAVTRQANTLWQTSGMIVWQRNYYEHIVRDDADLDRIRRYIAANPTRWKR
jgi:REP element-mobilizing transposase RayT